MSEQPEKTPKTPAMDLYMDKVRAFVRENGGSGNVIDVTTLLTVLLNEKEVRDFIVRQTDISERLVGNIANTAKETAENFIRRVMTGGSAPASESGEIGFYDTLDIVNAGPQFVKRNRDGESAPQSMVDIFVALAVAPELAFTKSGEPHPSYSVHKALGELRLGDLRDKLLEIEYGTSNPREIYWATPPREPTGRAIALVRSGASIDEALAAEREQQKTPLALTMGRAAQPAAPNEEAASDAVREQVKLILSILNDPEAVAELLGNPAGRAAIEEFAQKLARFDPGALQPPGEKPPEPGHG